MAASAYFDTVQKLYIAFYQRPADSAGLKYWAEQIDAANGNIDAAIQAFSTQEEAVELYGEIDETTIESVLDSIYFAAFGRSPEQEELDYWVPEFVAGRVTPSNIALAVVLGALGTDAATIDNKLVVANEFTTQVDGRPLTDPAFGTAPFAATYDGYDDVAAARDLLAGVTDDPASILSPEDITTAIVDTIADEGDAIIPVEPAPTFSLTADADSADEGDTVTFTVEGGKANFTYNYELTGVDATDVEDGVLTGTVTTDADGNGTFEVTLAADRATDGADTLTATLPNTGLSASVTVNDTSLDNIAPVAVDATANAIEEGAVVTGQLEATDADDDALTFTLDAPLQGLTLNADGSYSFDPTQNDIVKALTTAGGSTDLVATYTVTDALGATDTGTLTITAAPAPLSFKLEVGATTVNEDGSITFTVTANEAVAAATDVVFTLKPGNSTAADQGTDTTNLNDFDQGAFNPVTKQIAAGGTSVTFTITAPNDNVTELAESFSVQAVVGGQTLTATATLLDGSTGAGKTYMLTKGLDNVPGTAGNDTIIGSIDTAAATPNAELVTLTSSDIINGGAGTDTLKIAHSGTQSTTTLGNLTNVEIVEIESSSTGGVTVDSSNVAGITNLNVTKAAAVVKATAGATTDIAVTLKDNTTVASAHTVDGGKNVTFTLTDAGGAGPDTITIGAAAAATTPKGDVVVNVTGKAYDAANGDVTLGAIWVDGGKTVSVTQKATSDAAKAAVDTGIDTVTQGAVTVNANADTTTVTIKQDATVAKIAAAPSTGGVTETATIKFGALKTNDTLAVNGLTFKALENLSGEQVAAAFSNMVSGLAVAGKDTQGSQVASKGVFTGAFDTTGAAGYTAAAASGDTVVFTAARANLDATDLAIGSTITLTNTSGNSVAPTVTVVQGKAHDATPAGGVMGVAAGAVTIAGAAATAVKTVTVDGYAATTSAGLTATTSALETLNLSNGGDFVVTQAAATLAMNLTNVGTAAKAATPTSAAVTAAYAVLDLNNTATKTLNIKSNGTNTVELDLAGATGTTTLNVSGTGLLNAGGSAGAASTLGNVTTIKVTETAGLNLSNATVTNVTSVDTTGTTGATTIAIDGGKATYAGGAGVDTVTVSAATGGFTKAIDLGAGNDTLNLEALTVAQLQALPVTNVLKGGEGDDTIALTAAQAVDLSANSTFAGKIEGFEKLSLTKATATGTVNLANLDNINYVVSKGSDSVTAAATKATFTVDLAGTTSITTGDSLAFDGATFNGAGAITANALALALGGLTYTTWDVKSVSGTTITFEAKVAGTPASVPPGPALPVGAVFALTDGDASSTFAQATSASTAGVAAGAAAAALTIDNLASGGTLELTGESAGAIVKVKDAATSTADVLNVVTKVLDTGTGAGTVTAENVETINLKVNNADSGWNDLGYKSADGVNNVFTPKVSTTTITLKGNDSLKAVTVDGAGHVKLLDSSTINAKLATIDANTLTGNLTLDLSAHNGVAVTVTGGQGSDNLKASVGTNAKADVINGGAGNDTITAGSNGAQLTGGAGNDLFILTASSATTGNKEIGTFSSILDFGVGADVLDLGFYNNTGGAVNGGTGTNNVANGAVGTVSSFAKLTAVIDAELGLNNYINAAINQGTVGQAVWFNFNGNAYVVVDSGSEATAFQNEQDLVIRLTGVNGDNLSYNQTEGTIALI